MIDTKSLREKVLDLAIRGKLVPQDPNDEPASVLLERIREQKLQMVKEGKLKAKDLKNDTIIFKGEDNLHYEKFQDATIECIEDDIPFDIPDSWLWVRFSTVTINRDSERKPISLKERTKIQKIYDYYGASGAIDKVDDYLFNERLLLIGEDGANLVTRSKPIAFFAEGKYWVNNHAHCIDATDKRYLDFICLYINSINLEKYITGAAQPKMNQDNMNSILIPFPPFEEQLRISNYVNELFDFIETINGEKEELLILIEGAKSKILDLAIKGQLVPQDLNDEPASVLLERIRSEKEELIKQGKIKRDKKESIIFRGEDNSYYEKFYDGTIKCIEGDIPFTLPDNWSWTKLGYIGSWQSGATPSRNHPEYFGGRIPWLKTGDLNDGLINSVSEFITQDGMNNSSVVLNPIGSVLIAMYGATIGKLGIANIELTTNQACCACLPLEGIHNLYLFYYLLSQREIFISRGTGGAQPNISKEKIVSTLFPVPPYLEQIRIIERLQSLNTIVEYIEKSLD